MEKTEVLENIATLSEMNLVTKEELVRAFNSGKVKAAPSGSSINFKVVTPGVNELEEKAPASALLPSMEEQAPASLMKRISVAQILFYIGAAIVFLGIVFMIAQNWSTLGTLPRLLLTFGSGIAAYYIGFAVSRDERAEKMAPAFFLISALTTPIGLYVAIDAAGVKTSGYGYQIFISGILLVTYLMSFYAFRKSIFVLFSILFGTWFFFSITSYLLITGPNFDEFDFYMYRFLAAGLSYLFLAHFLAMGEHASISGFLNNFGLVGFLGGALALGGWQPHQNVFWEVFYPGFVFGALFLSVKLKSVAYLTWGSIFLMLFLIKTTSEYFSKGMGWPAALVLVGLMLIGIGYMSLSLKRKYI